MGQLRELEVDGGREGDSHRDYFAKGIDAPPKPAQQEKNLSVQNRRKSRMGYSLEHHLEAAFQALKIAHDREAVTENNNRPDFLFPSAEAYRTAPVTGLVGLAMLGAKSTCKDRWRQVLTEAAKIPRKHLLTLEPGITESQTAQMAASNLQLVVPKAIHGSYSEKQQAWLWTLGHFVQYVKPGVGN